MHENDRQSKKILVVEAQAIGMVGVIRGLGQAGYAVIAVSHDDQALGLRSNYASEAWVCPAYEDEKYLPWLNQFLKENKIDAIVPSEGFLLAIRDDFEKYQDLIPGEVDKETTYKCLCKSDVFHSFISAPNVSPVQKHIPKTIIVIGEKTVPDEGQLAALGLPIWIKVDGYYARGEGYFGEIICAETVAEARQQILRILPKAEKILVQSHEIGVKATVNLCIHKGKLLARSECVATHETPHTGGLTSLRHNWVKEDMFQDAMARIEQLGWDGVAMMEYKWDAKKQDYCFIEINSRYWAALHLDLFCDINFPQIQLDAFFGFSPEPILSPPKYVTARHAFPSDFGHAVGKVRDSNVPVGEKISCFFGFFLLFLNPVIKADLLYPGDRKLYWIQLKKTLMDLFR